MTFERWAFALFKATMIITIIVVSLLITGGHVVHENPQKDSSTEPLYLALHSDEYLARNGLGPAYEYGLAYGSDEYYTALADQAELAQLYAELWTAEVHALATHLGVTVQIYIGGNKAALDRYQVGRNILLDEIRQSAHDALYVMRVDDRWAVRR